MIWLIPIGIFLIYAVYKIVKAGKDIDGLFNGVKPAEPPKTEDKKDVA